MQAPCGKFWKKWKSTYKWVSCNVYSCSLWNAHQVLLNILTVARIHLEYPQFCGDSHIKTMLFLCLLITIVCVSSCLHDQLSAKKHRQKSIACMGYWCHYRSLGGIGYKATGNSIFSILTLSCMNYFLTLKYSIFYVYE